MFIINVLVFIKNIVALNALVCRICYVKMVKYLLQVSKSVRLKISTNSVRRARWYTRLGFYNILPNIPGHISSILPQGGNIYSLTAYIPRIYPLLYIEKQIDGKTSM